MKKVFLLLVCLLFVFSSSAAELKYVFLLIGDGFGQNQRKITEDLLGKKLLMSRMPVTVLTGTNNIFDKTTDSAASGTAIACGVKTYNGSIGLDQEKKALESISSKLKKRGFKIGIISSTHLTDATPATHYAHQLNRGMLDEIGKEMALSGFDFFGGAEVRGKETLKALEENGYMVLSGPDALAKVQKNVKTYVHSQPYTKRSPDEKALGVTLADYLDKAIELFEDNPAGFFIMLENGQIDKSGHANDSGKMWREVLALDEALARALAFRERHPEETLIIVSADHETGGLTLDPDYNPARLELLRKQIRNSDECALEVGAMMTAGKKPEEIVRYMNESLGVPMSGEDAARVERKVNEYYRSLETSGAEAGKSKPKPSVAFLNRIFLNRDKSIGFHYTTGGHSPAQIITNVIGPRQELFRRPLENSDLPHLINRITNGEADEEYWANRQTRLEEYDLLLNYRGEGISSASDALRLRLIPYKSLTTELGGKTFRLDLPHYATFVNVSLRTGNGFYFFELQNTSSDKPLLFGLDFDQKIPDTKTYYFYEPVKKQIFNDDAGNKKWTVKTLKDSARIFLSPGEKKYLLLSEKAMPAFEQTSYRAHDLLSAYLKSPRPERPAFIVRSSDGITPENVEARLAAETDPIKFCDVSGKEIANAPLLRALTDKDHRKLYLRIDMRKPAPPLTKKANGRDSAVYDDDCVEFLLGSTEGRDYYHFAFGEKELYDSRSGDPAWNAKNVLLKSTYDKSNELWTLLIGLDLADFEIAGFPTFNLCIADKQSSQMSNLAPSGGDFHKRELFIPLELK